MGERVQIVDVTLRDGLQNEPRPVSTAEKLALMEKLVRAGVTSIQATSFVHPKWVPQMADAEQVAAGMSKYPGVQFSALVPNMKGYQRAVAAGFRHLEFVMSATEKFNQKNLNMSIAESLKLLSQVTREAERDGVVIRIGFATGFHSPFDGETPTSTLMSVMRAARELCSWRVTLSDTDGMAFPRQVRAIIAALRDELKIMPAELYLHFHDTYGRGLANSLAGLDAGARTFDVSSGGLGGCPYCPGSSGNLATEDLVALLHGMGYETGINLDKLLDAAEYASRFSARPYQGHLLRACRPGACEVPPKEMKEQAV
jgi:hydroxymethylglutaryl-CoA lyase